MAKRGKIKKYARVKGKGNDCPKCEIPMQRRERILPPKKKTYFYTEWDYCKQCSHVQHYDEYKSTKWKEDEAIDNHLFSIKNEV